jgi:hypothetical protein
MTCMVCMPIISTIQEENHRPRQKKRPYLKNKAERARGVVCVVECLSRKCEALSSNPTTTQNKQTKKYVLLLFSYDEANRSEDNYR